MATKKKPAAPAEKKKPAALATGQSRKSPAGTWSGPKPSREAVKARGGAYREVYLSPALAKRLEAIRAKLGDRLPAERWLGALLRRAVGALECELGLPVGDDDDTP